MDSMQYFKQNDQEFYDDVYSFERVRGCQFLKLYISMFEKWLESPQRLPAVSKPKVRMRVTSAWGQEFQQWKLLCLWKYTHQFSGFRCLNEKDVNYQELANENLFKHNFGVCDESPPKSHLRQRFYRGDCAKPFHLGVQFLDLCEPVNRRSPSYYYFCSLPVCCYVFITFLLILQCFKIH